MHQMYVYTYMNFATDFVQTLFRVKLL